MAGRVGLGESARDQRENDSPPRPAVLAVRCRRSSHQRDRRAKLLSDNKSYYNAVVLDDLHQQCWLRDITILVDGADYLIEVLAEDGYDYEHVPHGNRSAVERIFRKVECRTSSFANSFSNVALSTAESWPEAFAVYYDAR